MYQLCSLAMWRILREEKLGLCLVLFLKSDERECNDTGCGKEIVLSYCVPKHKHLTFDWLLFRGHVKCFKLFMIKTETRATFCFGL